MSQKYKVFINNKPKIIDDNWKSFCSNYKLVIAAGGVVHNVNSETLMIFRNGKWDLPKGKLEKNESIESCALREVSEECGINNLIIKNKIIDTFHTYSENNVSILKKTSWFLMDYFNSEELVPQLSEGITKVKWIKNNEIDIFLKNTYGTINEVFKT